MLFNCDRFPAILQTNYLWSLPLVMGLIAQTQATASAQVIPDSTLPQNSVVAPNGDIIEITGGTNRGDNLFHSFEQFSVLTNQTAVFNNATSIQNIIGRVTGGSISEIDGLIRSLSTADLFLINPNGIIFGENAALDVGGSFISSTADSILFADGTEFSAINPAAPPLLTVSIPVGLQYGGQNGDITVRGSGNNLFIDFDTFTVDRNSRPIGLEVKSENTLALVGGNVFLEGGNLTAPKGNIELGSVAGEGTVGLISNDAGWKLSYEAVSSFQEIGLSQAASLEASGNSGGRVRVKGGYVSLTDGSAILTDTLGNGSGGFLAIEAKETEIYGTAENGFTSSLFTNVDLGATGNGGDLTIDTGYLYVGDGAQVNVNTFGLGNAGTLTVRADEIELLGGSEDGEFPSGLFAQADIGETGRGGDLDIEAEYLLVADGASISVATFGEGDAGTLHVVANEIELIGGSRDFGSSGLFVSTEFDSGSGGNLDIETDYLYIADGAQAVASTFSEGDAGNINVRANEIELIGTSPGGTPSALFSTVEAGAMGNGGNLQIDANNLSVADGAQIAVSTAGLGSGGTLDITATNVELSGFGESTSSGLFSNAIISSGDGGNINLTSDRLTISNGATISASNFASRNDDLPPGTGTPGKIDINVNELELDSTIPNEFSSITASTNSQAGGSIALNVASEISLSNGSRIISETRGEGEGGSIDVTANSLKLNNGSLLSTDTSASGDAGKINLQVNTANFTGAGSGIFSEVGDTASGDGGSIDISANKFNLNNQARVSADSTGLGQAGNIAIASDSILLDDGQITATSTQTGGGEINLVTNFLLLDNNSLISTSVLDSTGGGGNILIANENGFVIGRDNSSIRANAVFGSGGNIQINSQGIFFDLDSEITASSQFGADGIVEINNIESDKKLGTVQLPDSITAPEAVIVSSCPVPEENTFTVTGTGGLPENPSSYLRGHTVWQDMRELTGNSDVESERSPGMDSQSKGNTVAEVSDEVIVETQGWIVNDRGNLELVATAPQTAAKVFWQRSLKCGDL